MIKILITGIAGFIGTNLTEHLLKNKNLSISGIDNFDSFYDDKIKRENLNGLRNSGNFEFIEGDLLNTADLQKLETPDVIIHLAAKPGVRQSINALNEYVHSNMTGTQNILDFAKARGVKRVIFASSSSVYGINDRLPWKEDSQIMAVSPYAYSKASSEMLGQVYSFLYGIRFISLRFFSVYGPLQRPDLLINKIFSASSQGLPISIYGDGQASRDFTSIIDIIQAIELALAFEGNLFEVFNIGTGKSTSIIELVKIVEKVSERKIDISFEAPVDGDTPHTLADITKARNVLKYSPSVDLRSGLQAYHNWFTTDIAQTLH